jgi:Protein of Unknown function (DUF2784)
MPGSAIYYAIAADVVLALHIVVAAFVVGGLGLMVLGNVWRLSWLSFVNRPAYRFTHLSAIAVIVLQSWLGAICPLTILEMWLRSRAGEATYQGSFIAHWMQQLLYYQAPPWVFTLAYTVFGLLVLLCWVRFPLRPRR